jgi:hypothetical protein
MKTIITEVAINHVSLKYTDVDGNGHEYDIRAPLGGGYVRHGDKGDQLFERFAGSGVTMLWDGRAPLVDLIRREYRAMRRDEQRANDEE